MSQTDVTALDPRICPRCGSLRDVCLTCGEPLRCNTVGCVVEPAPKEGQ